jgi:hypothetical protein
VVPAVAAGLSILPLALVIGLDLNRLQRWKQLNLCDSNDCPVEPLLGEPCPEAIRAAEDQSSKGAALIQSLVEAAESMVDTEPALAFIADPGDIACVEPAPAYTEDPNNLSRASSSAAAATT